jgi:hypothetical protein
MNDVIKIISEQLRGNAAGVAQNEYGWRNIIGRVFSDTDGVYTEEERNQIREAARVYDRTKLLADVMELLAKGPEDRSQRGALVATHDESYYGRGLAQLIHDTMQGPQIAKYATTSN